jgi:serine phosphatase RsbU (regulator of sigma subunit)/anti-sigma regulatory factor (Ser/Thr protein kinase)
MIAFFSKLGQLWRGATQAEARSRQNSSAAATQATAATGLDVAPDDPIIAYFQDNPGVAEVSKLNFDSPVLQTLRLSGVQLIVPLVSQGELIGLLNLGPHLSQQAYSIDDRRLLDNLAAQAAPALRVAQLVRQQQAEAQAHERLEQELHVAKIIQQTLLPKELPQWPGWQVAAYYRPAREIGGDFYDFLTFPDGQVGIIIGDVSNKGIPAALVMATTRSILRATAERLISPGPVLTRVNELLYNDIPRMMFVTCLYALLDPASGRLRWANAGHNLPYQRCQNNVIELRATGMVLGVMPDMQYEEKEAFLNPNDTILFYTDGIVEAHNPQEEMFGYPHLQALVAHYPTRGAALIDSLLAELATFTGPTWEQEDDVTLVILERLAAPAGHILAEFAIASAPGNEIQAMRQVAAIVQPLNLPQAQVERLKTAVAEATMNAIEHGNKNQPELPVQIQVMASETKLTVRVTDQGGGQPLPEPETPNLEAKLAGLQTPRGWGLFLIKNLMDELHQINADCQHTLELVLYLEGARHAPETL